MKTIKMLLALVVAVSTLALAESPRDTKKTNVNWIAAEKNYLEALASDNDGVRHSAASLIAEYKLSGCMNCLIGTLKNDRVENVRMAAAYALISIGDHQGRTAVEEAALFDGSEKVAQFCESLLTASITQEKNQD